MSIVKYALIAVSVSVSSVAFSSVEAKDEISVAQDEVAEYRALRRACAITRGQERKACFSDLNDATESYQAAKKFLATRGLGSEVTLLSEAR